MGNFTIKLIQSFLNSNISFFNNLNEINTANSIVFNSVFDGELDKSELWQHFQGIEIETPKDIFDDEILNLMDFNCDQRSNVHFFILSRLVKIRH